VSPVALYVPGGERLASGARYRDLIRDAFVRFVQPQLVPFAGLEQIWIIGHGMASALLETDGSHPISGMVFEIRARLDSARVVAQPQGDRAAPGRHRRELARLVSALSNDLAAVPMESTSPRPPIAGRNSDPAMRMNDGCALVAYPTAARSVVRATYWFSRLCFKRDIIESLGEDDTFEVATPAGAFRMTKGEFYADFANVAASRSYRDRGVYH
jgi:hypothetical protein